MIKSEDELRLTRSYKISRTIKGQPKRNYGQWMFNGWDEEYLSFVDQFGGNAIYLLLPRAKDEVFGEEWEIKLVKLKKEAQSND